MDRRGNAFRWRVRVLDYRKIMLFRETPDAPCRLATGEMYGENGAGPFRNLGGDGFRSMFPVSSISREPECTHMQDGTTVAQNVIGL